MYVSSKKSVLSLSLKLSSSGNQSWGWGGCPVLALCSSHVSNKPGSQSSRWQTLSSLEDKLVEGVGNSPDEFLGSSIPFTKNQR